MNQRLVADVYLGGGPPTTSQLRSRATRRIKGSNTVKKPLWVVVGGVVVVLGLLFTLQGADVIGGSAMSGTTFWAVAGPIIIVIGLTVATVGVRGRVR
jgi:hypothetical protein